MSPGVNHSESRSNTNYSLHVHAPASFADGKTLREIMRYAGRDPKLIGELAAKKSRNERTRLVLKQQLIGSKADPLARRESEQAKDCAFVFSKPRGRATIEVKPAWSIIVCAGSYEA